MAWSDRRKEEEVKEDRNEVVERSENSVNAEESNRVRSGKQANMVKRDWETVTDVTLVWIDRRGQEKTNYCLRLDLCTRVIADWVAISISQSD
jgi:response regulator RpfG family c-di-GMP phosphodiesterase